MNKDELAQKLSNMTPEQLLNLNKQLIEQSMMINQQLERDYPIRLARLAQLTNCLESVLDFTLTALENDYNHIPKREFILILIAYEEIKQYKSETK